MEHREQEDAMAFISEHVKKNSDKCMNCAFMKIRAVKLDRHSILYDEAKMTFEGLVEGMNRGMCTMCPSCKDFEKVYGVKPYEYFKFSDQK